MIVGVARETFPGERRVGLVPEGVRRLIANKIEVAVASGAGQAAWFSDDDYARAGARLEAAPEKLLEHADLVVKINPPTLLEVEALRRGAALVCLLYPRAHVDATLRLAARGVTTLALENLPRTTVAQSMDVLSSQSSAAGYRAVIVAANLLAKFFPMLMTPAGTFAPARVLVLGAGVAGLQAIATARRLGALVEAFDVRRTVREQVESLGAKYIEPWVEQSAESADGYADQLTEAALERARNAIRLAFGQCRCLHYHRVGAAPARADTDHSGDVRVHASRLGAGRSRCRTGRQLRVDQGRRRFRLARRDDRRPAESRRRGRPGCQPDVFAQHGKIFGSCPARWSAALGL